MVRSLGKTLYTDVGQARECLRALMGQIRILPTANGYLEAELRHNTEGLIKLAMGDPFKARVVAGAGFGSNFKPLIIRVKLKLPMILYPILYPKKSPADAAIKRT